MSFHVVYQVADLAYSLLCLAHESNVLLLCAGVFLGKLGQESVRAWIATRVRGFSDLTICGLLMVMIRGLLVLTRMTWIFRKKATIAVFPEQRGLFRHGGKYYFRDGFDIVHEATMTGGTVRSEGKIDLSFTLVPSQSAEKGSEAKGESILADHQDGFVDRETLPKGAVKIYRGVNDYHSMGFVAFDTLIMARHGTANLGEVTLQGKTGKCVRIDFSRARFPTEDFEDKRDSVSCIDLAVIPLTADERATIGVKSLALTDFKFAYEEQRASIVFYNTKRSHLVSAGGHTLPGEPKNHNLGIGLAKINSIPGASSAPVWVVDGKDKCIGMWLGRPTRSLSGEEGKCNAFLHADALLAALDQCEIKCNPLMARLERQLERYQTPCGESREDKKARAARRWAEYLHAYYEELEERKQADGDLEDYYDEMLWGECIEENPPDAEGHTAPGLSRGHVTERRVKYWLGMLASGRVEDCYKDVYKWHKSGDSPGGIGAAKVILQSEVMSDYRAYLEAVKPKWGEHEDVMPDKNGKPMFTKSGEFTVGQKFGKKKKSSVSGVISAMKKRLKELAEKYQEKGEFIVPEVTKENIEGSMRVQSKKAVVDHFEITKEAQIDLEKAFDVARCKYGQKKTIPTYLNLGAEGQYKGLAGFDDKSSGISTRYRNLTKSKWVSENSEELIHFGLCRILLMMAAGPQALSRATPEEMIECGVSDVRDLFIKGEGHSPSKTSEGRFRLIWVCSVVDVVVQTLLHKHDNAVHIDRYQSGDLTCCALGLGHHDAGIDCLVRAMAREGLRENVSSDASAFDWSVCGEFIRYDARRRADNAGGAEGITWLMEALGETLCSHVVHNNGDVWTCHKDGVNCSGQVSTSAQNTFVRSVLAVLGGAKGFVCAGDDLVADKNFEPERLEYYGINSRDVEEHWNSASFTSHYIDFGRRTARFLNVEKMLWHLHNTLDDEEVVPAKLGGCLFVLRNTPDVQKDLRQIAEDFGVPTSEHEISNNEIMRELS